MPNFLDSALASGAELPDNVEKTEEEVAEKTEKEVPSGEPEKEAKQEPAKEEPIKEEPVKEDPKVDEAKEQAAATKKEIDYKSWLETNEETLRQYLNEKNTDYKALPPVELVRRRIQAENPEFTSDDVASELEDKYGVGLTLIEIDEDVMLPEELAEAKRQNRATEKEIAKGLRALKSDSAKAVEFFEHNKQSLSLPKFEIDEVLPAKEEPVSLETYQEQLITQAEEQREKEWIPQIKQVVDPLEALTEQVEYEDNGNKVVLDVTYKLSKEEKDQIQEDLNEYITSARDGKYVDAQGNADVQRFVEDKAKELHFKKLLKTVF